jgi:hypothetical protein
MARRERAALIRCATGARLSKIRFPLLQPTTPKKTEGWPTTTRIRWTMTGLTCPGGGRPLWRWAWHWLLELSTSTFRPGHEAQPGQWNEKRFSHRRQHHTGLKRSRLPGSSKPTPVRCPNNAASLVRSMSGRGGLSRYATLLRRCAALPVPNNTTSTPGSCRA